MKLLKCWISRTFKIADNYANGHTEKYALRKWTNRKSQRNKNDRKESNGNLKVKNPIYEKN